MTALPSLYLKKNQSFVVKPVSLKPAGNKVSNEICAVWVITQRVGGNYLPTFRTVHQSHLQRSGNPGPLKMGQTVCPETSVRKY